MRRIRTVTLAQPTETGVLRGLAYSLWMPAAPTGGVVVVHGADSAKENQYDFARAALGTGLAVVCFDQHGHGRSDGALGASALDDVAMMASLLREKLEEAGGPGAAEHHEQRIALRGSSMGGYLVLAAAQQTGSSAVVAICPASDGQLRDGLARDKFDFAADKRALDGLLSEHPLDDAVAALPMPVLLMHAEGDEVVPVEHSRELAGRLRHPASRLIEVRGGHHRSVQHDPDLQAISLRFLRRALAEP